ncbi:SgcJ/EcaC family oxidoreductase [Mycobacterium sp. 236(2023)]|uniref:YybH family protein n=1 Tax=Mycobacterium sp. 236(2023) TaxID=3038163 RepID=UPI0024156CBA|nr:SgcJ/EcaC family oxidoreductase [Mycobacterium sp. 236(2023)]MDG4663049.1 SgcJ/EcaC family oxidoreductase [Mycobacterium sp. 236(2023)]
MTDDQNAIRTVVERWIGAIQARDLDGVVAAHTDDIVMFDVPPPQNGVRGRAEYRDCWPPFFEFIASGAVFELVELDVTAGADVAFARALLRCGTADEFAENPDRRLRITVGLRKVDSEWLIAHEHHSFPLD